MLTRQNLPTIDREKYAPASGIARGAYVLADAADGGAPDVILIASGSEVALALEAHERLVAEGVRSRVVNMASCGSSSSRTPPTARASCRPPAARASRSRPASRSAGSAGSATAAWSSASTASAPRRRPATLFQEFGFTADNVYARAKALLA